MTTITTRGRTADDCRNPLALMDYGDGGRHGDPHRHRLGATNGRFTLGVRFDLPAGGGQQVVWFVDELAEQLGGPSTRGKTSAFAHIVGQLLGQVKQLRADNTALRAENSVLHNEIQSLDLQLQRAREGRDGGTE